MFTNKVYSRRVQLKKVPQSCWEETSVDLFGPLQSRNHIVVIQDRSSCYPVAKLFKSSKEKSIIFALKYVYDTFGNPIRQKSDNRAPFNSKEMENVIKYRYIEQIKTSSGYNSPNNLETVMNPLGKAIKIDCSV